MALNMLCVATVLYQFSNRMHIFHKKYNEVCLLVQLIVVIAATLKSFLHSPNMLLKRHGVLDL